MLSGVGKGVLNCVICFLVMIIPLIDIDKSSIYYPGKGERKAPEPPNFYSNSWVCL